MANNIPVFEFGKDSYILKHKLDYNTQCNDDWSGYTYGILFTDYNLARKTQSQNAEQFDEIVIDYDIEDVGSLLLTYYDENYLISLIGRWVNTEQVMSGSTISETGATFINGDRFQQYYIPSGASILFQEGDFFNIYFHIISGVTGTTSWSHLGPSGETYVVTGRTENGIPWQVTGQTTVDGFSSGVTDWYVLDYTPILKYRAHATEIGSNYIKFEKKLEDYVYNNLISLSNNTNSLFYTLESLDFTNKNYYAIKYIFEESKWSDYFSLSATTDQLIIKPIPNKADLYFDYDNVEIQVNTTGGTEYKYFETNCLYVKYKLDIFLEQFGYETGTTVHYDHLSLTSSLPYNNEIEFEIEFLNSGDTEFFFPFTYIYTTGSTGNVHICLILDISGTTMRILTARVGMTVGEEIVSINNMHTIGDISKMLYECYINIENDIMSASEFYDANYYDPNILGSNVIDPNIIGNWVFDPIS